MQRGDLSKIPLASGATSALVANSVQAQTCTAPCYTRAAAETTAGVTPTNLSYPPGDIRRYGADSSGSADSPVALQNALNVAQAVYFPAGLYSISAALTNGISNRRIYGDGPSASTLRPHGAINAIVNTAGLSCVQMDNFAIIANDTTTLDAMTQASNTALFASRFENLSIYTGGEHFTGVVESSTSQFVISIW